MIRLAAAGLLLCGVLGCAPIHYTVIEADQVTLVLQAPEASQVSFVSSLDEYNLHATSKNNEGKWLMTMPAQQEFQYFYLVDGKFFLPDCQFKEADDFGTFNCRYLP